jgi:hypothetical protein
VKQRRHRRRSRGIYPSNIPPSITYHLHRVPISQKKIAVMGRFGGSQDLPAHQEDEDLFETSSSISGDSNDEARLSDAEAPQEHSQFGLRVAPKTVRRLNSDSACFSCNVLCRKGLSRYYDGKSQSFACMSEVRCLEDLPKKRAPAGRSRAM